jgi:transcriptional regulator with XRE-family HTH domain
LLGGSFRDSQPLRPGDLAISQRELAGLAGTSSARISAYESGKRQPTIAGANEVLRALGLQLVLSTEPADADLDRRIDELARQPLGQRLLTIRPHVAAVMDLLEDAASAPPPPRAPTPRRRGCSISSRSAGSGRVHRPGNPAREDRRRGGQVRLASPVRWSAEHDRYLTGIPVDPRLEGSMRGRSSWGELRGRCDEPHRRGGPEPGSAGRPGDRTQPSPVALGQASAEGGQRCLDIVSGVVQVERGAHLTGAGSRGNACVG